MVSSKLSSFWIEALEFAATCTRIGQSKVFF